VSQALENLETCGRAQIIKRYGIRFWSAAPAYYPDNDQSQRIAPNHKNSMKLISTNAKAESNIGDIS
jgi:hypothetical protein